MRSSEARRLIKMNHLDPCTKKNGDVNVLKTVQVKILKEFPSAIIKKFIHLIYTDVLMRGSSCALYSFSLTKPCLEKGREAINRSLNPDYDPDDQDVDASSGVGAPLLSNRPPDIPNPSDADPRTAIKSV
ncbi:unnamed protein product [Microthlaspi erraticum]|uniref:Uncharacterized protein n=1 Tax=Microthlaspi erraticum TaxID=1685480 RepID=A0A6D2KCN3_9BRAS|nr:unnamed protein product [Microthlaspi erraticum]